MQVGKKILLLSRIPASSMEEGTIYLYFNGLHYFVIQSTAVKVHGVIYKQ